MSGFDPSVVALRQMAFDTPNDQCTPSASELARLEGLPGESGAGRCPIRSGVVQAISLLPRVQSRTLMQDLLYKGSNELDPRSLREVLTWLRDAGHTLREVDSERKRAPDPDRDEAIGDLGKTARARPSSDARAAAPE